MKKKREREKGGRGGRERIPCTDLLAKCWYWPAAETKVESQEFNPVLPLGGRDPIT